MHVPSRVVVGYNYVYVRQSDVMYPLTLYEVVVNAKNIPQVAVVAGIHH